MKTILEFHPVEDKFELEAAMKATDMWLVLKNTIETLKKELSQAEDWDNKQRESALKLIQNTLLEEITDNGLDNLIFNY